MSDFTSILDDTFIGDRCEIWRNVVINQGVTIGSGVKIQNYVSIPSGVTIDSCAFVGPGATFLNDRHPRSFVTPAYGPQTNVRLGASIGANTTVVCGERTPTIIGEFSMLAAGSTVTRSTKPFSLNIGNEQRGWVNVLGDTVSHRPSPIPSADVLLRGIEQIPDLARPNELSLAIIMHCAGVAYEP